MTWLEAFLAAAILIGVVGLLVAALVGWAKIRNKIRWGIGDYLTVPLVGLFLFMVVTIKIGGVA